MDLTLYGVVGRGFTAGRDIVQSVEQAILGGVTVIQLREKDLSSREFLNTAFRLKEVTSKYGIPLIINDRIDIALAVDADGVHLGQDDIPLEIARRIMGDKIIGISVSCVEHALEAQRKGADYLGIGPVFPTSSKRDIQKVLYPEEMERIARSVEIPSVAIGGINKERLSQVKGRGIDGIAVISALFLAPDIKEAARELVQGWKA